jgi:hypothetical protein
VLEKQLELRAIQAVLSYPRMRGMDLLACIDPSTEKHGNKHDLPGAQARHVSSLKKLAQLLIFHHSLIEPLRSSLDRLLSTNNWYRFSIMLLLKSVEATMMLYSAEGLILRVWQVQSIH